MMLQNEQMKEKKKSCLKINNNQIDNAKDIDF